MGVKRINNEHMGRGRICFVKGRTLPLPKKQRTRAKRLTPMRDRAARAGVLHRYKDTPPGLRKRAEDGSPSAKKQLQAMHKHNHQIVDRAEVAAAPDKTQHFLRLESDAQSHRKRKLSM